MSLLAGADFGFYSYFKDHINILFFGLFDDDTSALLITFWQNYNVIFILSLFFIYSFFLFKVISFILNKENKYLKSFFGLKISFLIFTIIFVLNFLAIRGTLGMYPLGKMIPNVSENEFINKIPQNGFRAFTSAYNIRKKYLKREYDLIKETGYKNNIEKAFKDFKQTDNIDSKNLLNNITYKTKKIDDNDYNIVLIMVESFGMPITKYNSESYNILGNLKKHFDEDILFTNFISSGDGTISSLEALLLNIPKRPNAFAFSQSIYKQTSFDYTAGFLYKKHDYETSFIYGGDLSWRNLGKFIKYQGYDNVQGKINIFNNIKNKTKEESEYFHPWGIFDEHLYSHILDKLEDSKNKKQFIFALSTNNHPPYNIPSDYKSKPLIYTDEIKEHITGDFELAEQRFKSYAYAIDQVGIFLDKFKKSEFAKNTIVVVTADNNTIDGIMKYDDNQLLNSKNIPLYFYLPKELKNKLKIDTSIAGSHKDIFPTLYNLTLKDENYISIGYNLFDYEAKHYGFNGSMIVNQKENIFKLSKLKNETNNNLINYYKSSLAVTQFLINHYKD
ncbi:MAG: LTA synthase family protein [Halarcobacter sp.]